MVAGAAVLAGGAAAAAAAKTAAGDDVPAEELYPPVEPADYGLKGEQPVTTSTTTGGPLPSPGTANAVYPTDAEAVQPLGGLEPDLDTDEAARRRGETPGGNATPNPMG